MERSRVTRYIRISVTALSLTACVLLVALWVRSFSNGHLEGYLPAPANICCRSVDGVVFALRLPAQPVIEQGIQSFQTDSKPVDIGPSETSSGFALDWHSTSFWWIQVPHWFLVSVATLFGAVPWFRQPWRFSLRTLLIATTLVAVGLRAIIWVAR